MGRKITSKHTGLVIAVGLWLLILAVPSAFAESYKISASVDGTGQIQVDDGLEVSLNGVVIYDDLNATSGFRPPIAFIGNVGDQLRFRVRDTFGDCRTLSRLILTDSAGRFRMADPVFPTACGFPQGDNGFVYDATFTIPTLDPLPTFTDRGLPGSTLAGVVPARDGRLFGVTYEGGAFNKGTIYEFDPVTLMVTVRHSFNGAGDGDSPINNLVLDPSTGKLYGATFQGGPSG